MQDISMGVVETRFADLIWENAPLSSSELVKKAYSILTWKKSTTYTVLKRLCEKGLFENDNGTVKVLLSREDYYARQSHRFVEENFQGSLPAFLAAFTAQKALSSEEVAQLRRMVAEYGEG